MAVAKVEIIARRKCLSLDDFEWQVELYLSGLRSNGQIERDWLTEYQGRNITAVCQTSRPKASLPRYCSRFVKERLLTLRASFDAVPEWTILLQGKRPIRRDWSAAEFLFLSTSVFDTLYPLTIPGIPPIAVPTYTLPLAERTREDLRYWFDRFQHLEWVWMDSGKLEGRAYREYADPNSPFSLAGRELARKVERELKKPTYYFIPRYYGRRHGEQGRLCPGCGRKWRLKDADIERFGGMIAFRCVRCRLASEDSRYPGHPLAKVGEFQSPQASS